MKKKCIVLFSGGLDSRLVIKIMQKRGFEVIALFFKFPFGTGCCDEGCSFNFSQMQGVRLEVFDCTRGKLLQEYLDIVKKAKHGTGVGVNPCIDCRIFMLKKAKKFADEQGIEIIATGEVLGQRPMSQHKKGLEIIEKESELGSRLVRPLLEYGIQGRRRDKQIALAKKFKIKYPFPAGGCLLCEKELKKRLKFLLDRGLNEEEIKLIGIGRHFLIDSCWIVLGRNKEENKIIEDIKTGKIIIPEFKGPSAVVLDKCNNNIQKKVNELIKAYSKKGFLKERKKFDGVKL